MANETRPSFQFYPKDWLASTRGLSGAARGYHIDMLALSWLNGGCDTDPETLRRSVGAEKAEWRKVWPELSTRWVEVDGRLVNPRLERTRQEATAYQEAKRVAGSKGGKAKATGVANSKQTASTTPSKPLAESYPALALPHPHTTTVANAPVVDARFPFDGGAMPTRKRNLTMAWEGTREGLGVPDKLHREFLSKMAPPDEPALFAWYAATERAWKDVTVGDTVWDFWNARFREWRGTTKGHRPFGVGPSVPSSSVAVTDPDYNGAEYRFHCAHTPTCARWPQHRDLLNDEAVSA